MICDDSSPESVEVQVHLPPDWAEAQLRADARRAFANVPRTLPPRWLYDERGSQLFSAITGLPEHYPTEAEREVLRRHALEIVQRTGADTVVELGSGTSDKTRTLLDAFSETDQLRRFVALDVSQVTLVDAADQLASRYPGVQVHAVVGDFAHHLGQLPADGRRLVVFLGGTVGNFYPQERHAFFESVAAVLRPGEWFLIGVDLMKSVDRLVPAYFDSAGVTAQFILNALRVVNRQLGANFELDNFEYIPLWDPMEERMDLRLRCTGGQDVHIAALDLDVELFAGEEIRVEISTKFRLDALTAELAAAGLVVRSQWSDPNEDFALCLAERRTAKRQGCG